MEELWGWTKIILVLGGIVVTMVGLVWLRTAQLLRSFGKSVNTDRAFWVMIIGFLATCLGLGFFYFKL
jgi:hypothetical protein